jgi:hypothetical protein
MPIRERLNEGFSGQADVMKLRAEQEKKGPSREQTGLDTRTISCK